jgi:pyridoxal phosphate enzyme (YggS family)
MQFTPTLLAERIRLVRERIERAAGRVGRDPASIRILPVTKTLPAEAVRAAFQAGLPSVGENRVQEAVAKQSSVSDPVRWELIGHLQSNKVKAAVRAFDRIQSVDSMKRLDQIDRQAATLEKVLPVLLQVNAGRDPAKFGADLEDVPALLDHAQQCAHIRVDGLMTIAPLSDDPNVARRAFANLRECRDKLTRDADLALEELSMGMSGDLEAAVEEGSTMVRLGTVLFGER